MNSLATRVLDTLDHFPAKTTPSHYGQVCRFDGQFVECDGFPAPIGSLCEIDTITGVPAMGEIIGFNQGRNMLAMLDHDAKICDGATVKLINTGHHIPVGDHLLGRVTDALGAPLDDQPLADLNDSWPLAGKPLNPLKRNPITKPLDVGIKAINGLLTVGQGQRIGIVAGSGVGNSVMLSMMSRYTDADIVVIGLRSQHADLFVDSVSVAIP